MPLPNPHSWWLNSAYASALEMGKINAQSSVVVHVDAVIQESGL